jgi:PPP family 3-phenylpropionic acid transporter
MRYVSLPWAPPLYFLYYAAAATLLPFLTIYYQDLGLTGTQIGFLASLPPLLSLVSAPVWGVVSDMMKQRKLSLLIAISGAVLLALALSIVRGFIWMIPTVMLFAFFFSPIMPLVDTTTISLLGGQKERYGQLRLWGAVGWGVAAPIVGWLIETDSAAWSFWAYAGLMALGFFIALRIPETGRIEATSPTSLRIALASPRWFLFLVIAFSGGMSLSMISNFLFLFLFFSNRLLSRWNERQLIGAALLFFAIRAWAYSLIAVPWLALPIQLFHGPTFSLMWIAGVSYADRIAPTGLEATAQGLFAGVMLGIGSAAGAFLGGLLYEHVGPVMMFRLAALSSLVGMGFVYLVEKKSRESHV